MEINKAIQKQGLKWKCREHPSDLCELICLDGDAKERVLCFNCIQKHQIPVSNLISMSFVLATNQQVILEAYPPLKDQKLSSKLRVASLKQQLEEIEVYFKKLREDFEREIKAAEQRAKEALIKQEKSYHDLLEGYMKVAEVEKLKELIVSEKESAEKDLNEFIKEKWRKAEENRKIMADLINQYEGEQEFSSDESNKIAQDIIESLKRINFFKASFQQQQQVTLIKSTYNNSQQMEITKVDNSIYQVKKGTYNGQWDQVFLDPILDPLKKYILHIELEMKQGNCDNRFFFGLVKEEGKDNSQAYGQNMCYYDSSNCYGITKIIKGSPMLSGGKATGKHSFEVRINLNAKFLRVSSLPDYSSVAELDDSNKIDLKVAYRFFLSMYHQGDMMRITNFRTVSKFDEKM